MVILMINVELDSVWMGGKRNQKQIYCYQKGRYFMNDSC